MLNEELFSCSMSGISWSIFVVQSKDVLQGGFTWVLENVISLSRCTCYEARGGWQGFNYTITINLKEQERIITRANLINSPGLVVMGGGSRSKGRAFESRLRILDGHDIFSH